MRAQEYLRRWFALPASAIAGINPALTLAMICTMLSLSGCASKPAAHEPSLGVSRDPNPSDLTHGVDDTAEITATRKPWQFADFQGQLISTPHYHVYTTIENERILDRLPQFYERALQHYTTALAPLPMPDVQLETYLFQTRSQWQTKTTEMLPDQARMFSNLGRGGFTTKGISVLYYIDRFSSMRDTFAIAAHEGWHQYTQQTFKEQLPIWLEEGVATYMEGYQASRDGLPEFVPSANRERREALRDAVRSNRLISLDELLTRTPQSFLSTSKESLLTYYAQVWALTRFLAEGEDGRYKPALATLLKDAAEQRLVSRMMMSNALAGNRRQNPNAFNRVGPAVAREYFNRDLVEFEKQYLLFIDQILQSRQR